MVSVKDLNAVPSGQNAIQVPYCFWAEFRQLEARDSVALFVKIETSKIKLKRYQKQFTSAVKSGPLALSTSQNAIS